MHLNAFKAYRLGQRYLNSLLAAVFVERPVVDLQRDASDD